MHFFGARFRKCWILVVALVISNTVAQSDENHLIPTYKSPIEKLLQALISPFTSSSSGSSSSRSSSSRSSSKSSESGNFIGGIIDDISDIILEPIKNVTAQTFGDILNFFEDKFHAIYPGTLWCGGGNIASSEEDVGLFRKTDTCCRNHDNCPDYLTAGNSTGDIINDGIFTRSACTCDTEFYKCLKSANSPIANNIGSTYFNLLRPQCYAKYYPIESCKKYANNRLIDRKCEEYKYDKSKNMTLEWFDNPDF